MCTKASVRISCSAKTVQQLLVSLNHLSQSMYGEIVKLRLTPQVLGRVEARVTSTMGRCGAIARRQLQMPRRSARDDAVWFNAARPLQQGPYGAHVRSARYKRHGVIICATCLQVGGTPREDGCRAARITKSMRRRAIL